MDQQEWLDLGIRNKWVGPVFCYVHDAPDLTDDEMEVVEGDEGDLDGICIPVVRLTV